MIQQLFRGTRLQSARRICVVQLERVFELCALVVELGGQNSVFLAVMLPARMGFVPGAKMACVTLVHNVG